MEQTPFAPARRFVDRILRSGWLQPTPKHLLFAFIGLMYAYVLWNNERFLFDSKHPEWAHIQSFKWWLLPHGLAAACALFLGPLQFSDRLRQRLRPARDGPIDDRAEQADQTPQHHFDADKGDKVKVKAADGFHDGSRIVSFSRKTSGRCEGAFLSDRIFSSSSQRCFGAKDAPRNDIDGTKRRASIQSLIGFSIRAKEVR